MLYEDTDEAVSSLSCIAAASMKPSIKSKVSALGRCLSPQASPGCLLASRMGFCLCQCQCMHSAGRICSPPMTGSWCSGGAVGHHLLSLVLLVLPHRI